MNHIQNTLFVMLLVMATSMHQAIANELKEILVPKIEDSITIDGNLDEPIYAFGAQIDQFLENYESSEVEEDTKVYLFYDDDALYLTFVCQDKDIQATYTEHDAHLWDEEVFELFLYPGKTILNPVDYFELQWNPLGTVFDAIITNTLKENGQSKSFKGNHAWTATGMKHAVTVVGTVGNSEDVDTKWMGEVKIPFATLDVTSPKSGDTWRGNIYRYSRNTNEDMIYMAWNPTGSHFHEPNWFGKLVFE